MSSYSAYANLTQHNITTTEEDPATGRRKSSTSSPFDHQPKEHKHHVHLPHWMDGSTHEHSKEPTPFFDSAYIAGKKDTNDSIEEGKDQIQKERRESKTKKAVKGIWHGMEGTVEG